MAAKVDLNNPETWPDDPDELMKLTEGVKASGEETPPGEHKEGEEEKKESKEEGVTAKGDDATKEIKDTEQGETEITADKGEAEESSKKASSEEKAEENNRDDDLKNIIQSLSDQNKSIADANAQLLKEIRDSKSTGKEEEPGDDLTEEERGRIAKAKEAWGEDIAELVEGNIRLGKANKELSKQVTRLNEDVSSRSEREAQTEQASIQKAINSNPLMNAWQNDTKDGKWFDRAVKMHHMLMESDDEYANLPWNEKFNRLPDKVHSVYGESPHKAKFVTKEPAKDKTEEFKVAAKEKVDSAKHSVPKSMSDLTGAESEEKSVNDKLADMSDAELQDYFTNLAAKNPQKFEETLRALS